MKDLTFDELRAANVARNEEWDPNNVVTATFRATELAGEVGELCNIIKKFERMRLGLPGSLTNRSELIEELADVAICIDLLAMHYSVHLGEAVREKFNKTSDKYDFTVKL